MPYTNAEWERFSIFLSFLVPKLPAPKEEDLSRGILESIDMDSYRVEKRAAMKIQLPDADAEIKAVPTTGGGRKPEPQLDRLSNILRSFNDQFGNIPWTDAARIGRLITKELPEAVAADVAYQNARQNEISWWHAGGYLGRSDRLRWTHGSPDLRRGDPRRVLPPHPA